MAKITFFSVLGNNLKCAFCKNKECLVRYHPTREKTYFAGGKLVVIPCKKIKKKS